MSGPCSGWEVACRVEGSPCLFLHSPKGEEAQLTGIALASPAFTEAGQEAEKAAQDQGLLIQSWLFKALASPGSPPLQLGFGVGERLLSWGGQDLSCL